MSAYTRGTVIDPKRPAGKRNKTEIRTKRSSAEEHRAFFDAAEHGASRVGLKPAKAWHRRNFLTEVLIPSLFTRRARAHHPAALPELEPGQVALTWIGHASFLLQMGGKNILVDPNWALWLKVIKRIKQPGMKLHDLPNIDLVLVTHAHFDHLDRKTLRQVADAQPIMVPFGVGDLVHDLGFNIVHELDYWQSEAEGPLEVTLTPAHHWGARMLHDSHRGFGGFVLKAENRSIFHCGDTAYFDGFAEIGRRCGVEIALLPIGAYDPPSGREVHMNPEQAVKAFQELGAQTLIPMHYGTFRLSFEPVGEPLERLLSDAQKNGLQDRVTVLNEGLTVVL